MGDLISRQAAIDAADRTDYTGLAVEDVKKVTDEVVKEIKKLPSAQPTQTDTSNTLKALDCVERQAAIDALKRNTLRLTVAEEWNCEGHVAWDAEVVYSEVMEGMLLDLPSAQPNLQPTRCEECEAFNKTRLLIPQPERKWIPCSPETMPKKTGHYLVQYTRKYCRNEMAVAFYSVEEARCDDDYTWEIETFYDIKDVIAWRPLPEPYREDDAK